MTAYGDLNVNRRNMILVIFLVSLKTTKIYITSFSFETTLNFALRKIFHPM